MIYCGMARRNRVTGGLQASRVGNAQLSEAQVRSIRQLLKEGTSARELAEIHMLSVETIRRIGRRETWGWVEDLPPPPDLQQVPISPEEARLIEESKQRFLQLLNKK